MSRRRRRPAEASHQRLPRCPGRDADSPWSPRARNHRTAVGGLLCFNESDQAATTTSPLKISPLVRYWPASDRQAGTSWIGTASHELLEMLCSPKFNLTVFVQNSNMAGILYADEVCDACEDDSLG